MAGKPGRSPKKGQARTGKNVHGSVGSVGDVVIPGRRIEEVQPPGIDDEAHRLALPCLGLRMDARDEDRPFVPERLDELARIGAGRPLRNREMDEHLRTERLGQLGGHLHSAVGRRVRLEARVLEVLGPDAEDQGPADVFG